MRKMQIVESSPGLGADGVRGGAGGGGSVIAAAVRAVAACQRGRVSTY